MQMSESIIKEFMAGPKTKTLFSKEVKISGRSLEKVIRQLPENIGSYYTQTLKGEIHPDPVSDEELARKREVLLNTVPAQNGC